MWSTKSEHRVKAVEFHNVVRYDNRNEKRGGYTEDFKQEAVALVTERGYKPSETARSLGIGSNLIRRWKREFEEVATGVQLGVDEWEEQNRLWKENRLLRMEKENLKKPVRTSRRN